MKLSKSNGEVKNIKLHIFLIRHGEPKVYGDRNSGLSLKGKNQVTVAANTILRTFDQENYQKIKILYSDRRRAIESARALEKEFKKSIKSSKLKNIKILTSAPHSLMMTADSLDSLINLGYPLNTAYKIWISLPEKELKLFGIQSPEEIRKSINKYFIKQCEISQNTDKDYSLNIIGVTHETTLLAFQMKLFPVFKKKPDYAELMEVYFHRHGKPIFKYRGREAEY